MLNFAVLIPAYNPSKELIQLVNSLLGHGVNNIVIVNDGSDATANDIFSKLTSLPKVTLIQHAINLGKGAALKTGLNYIFTTYKDIIGTVTADADGQHSANDILAIGSTLQQNPNHLILGVREFKENVPFRSKFGNEITKGLYRLLIGQKIIDTQSGLRGIPRALIPALLRIHANGYEFELDMLLTCNHAKTSITQRSIQTIYIDNNESSHFNPLIDSIKIYFVLFRSLLLSFCTFLVDITVFFVATHLNCGLLLSQGLSRAVSIGFYYPFAKKRVFLSNANNQVTFPKYILLVIFSGAICYGIIKFLVNEFNMDSTAAKIFAESIIYICNFAIQREFIFTSKIDLELQ